MSVIVPISSALPLKADVAAEGRESPKLAHSGHKDGFPTSNCSGRKASLFKPFHEMVEHCWVAET